MQHDASRAREAQRVVDLDQCRGGAMPAQRHAPSSSVSACAACPAHHGPKAGGGRSRSPEGAHDEDRRHGTPTSVANVSAQVLVEPATLLAPAGGRCAGALRRHFKNREPWMTFVLGRFEGARDADWWHKTSISVTDASAQVLVESAHSAPHAAGRRVGALPAISKMRSFVNISVSRRKLLVSRKSSGLISKHLLKRYEISGFRPSQEVESS